MQDTSTATALQANAYSTPQKRPSRITYHSLSDEWNGREEQYDDEAEVKIRPSHIERAREDYDAYADADPLTYVSTLAGGHGQANGSTPGNHKTSRSESPAKDKHFRRIPWFVGPIPADVMEERERSGRTQSQRPDEEVPWLRKEDEASEWLSLFYDLIVVAILTVFSSTHELTSPSTILTFLSYFVILSWIWTSQVHYDIRFQAGDMWHREMKALQIMVFVYIGAASGNWGPGNIRDLGPEVGDGGDEARVWVEHEAASESFITVLVAFAVSRTVLALQYAVSAWLGYKARRCIGSHLLAMCGLLASSVFTVVAVTYPAQTDQSVAIKIGVFYAGIVAEVLCVWFQLSGTLRLKSGTKRIGDRYGAMTLIILGEGFISLVKGFSKAISGLSVNNTDTYFQVFLAMAIIYLLWSFLFSHHRPEESIARRRVLAWEAIHFPLHFGLLLLLAAIVNVIVVISYVHGIDVVATEFASTAEAIGKHISLTASDEQTISTYLDRLPLAPSYQEEFSLLNALTAQTQPEADPLILAYQYFAQIVLTTTQSYGIKLAPTTLDNLEAMYRVHSDWSANATVQSLRQMQAAGLLVSIVEEPVDEALSGTLWIFPCAGGVLILIAIRSILWYRPIGLSHYLAHALQITAGLGLSLLGLLDIGSKHIGGDDTTGNFGKTNDLYRLVSRRAPLAIILGVYAGVYYGGLLGVSLMGRCRRKSQAGEGV